MSNPIHDELIEAYNRAELAEAQASTLNAEREQWIIRACEAESEAEIQRVRAEKAEAGESAWEAAAGVQQARAEKAEAERDGKEANLQTMVVQNAALMRDAADLRAQRDTAVEARRHHYGEPFHDDPPEDCDFDRQGGQRDCPKCVANAMTRAALLLARGTP